MKLTLGKVLGFHSVAKHIVRMFKDLGSSQIWLNLPKDDHHFSYIFLWMVATFATNKTNS